MTSRVSSSATALCGKYDDYEYFTGADDHLALPIRSKVKLQRAFEMK